MDVARATPGDVAACLALNPGLQRERARHVAAAFAAGRGWIVRDAGEIAGFAHTGMFFGHALIELVFVAPGFRRRGAASALMRAIAAACEGDRIFTSTNESNASMRALCAKLGWAASGVIDNLDPGDPELIFVKCL
ncbi:MAG: N-acetyltransferase family protein [Hyphomonadaceae bacterium]